jgi:dihydrofolate reductase
MLVSMIAAMDRRGLIGDETGMPWHLSADLRRFRAITWGKPVIMGRRTFELIGKPLPGRLNIVLTRNPDYSFPDCRVARTFEEALAIAEGYLASSGGDETMIIGGGKVYAEAIHRWNRLYLTVVEGRFTGSTFFPVRELLRQPWRPAREPETHPPDAKNSHPYSFHVIESVEDATRRSPAEDRLAGAYADEGTALEGLDLAAVLARGTMGP